MGSLNTLNIESVPEELISHASGIENFKRIITFANRIKEGKSGFRYTNEQDCKRITELSRAVLRLVDLDTDILSIGRKKIGPALHHAIILHNKNLPGGIVLEPQTGDLMTFEEATTYYDTLFSLDGDIKLSPIILKKDGEEISFRKKF